MNSVLHFNHASTANRDLDAAKGMQIVLLKCDRAQAFLHIPAVATERRQPARAA
jgi:hypothetical protein